MAYPDTLLRGLITPGSVTSERYVTAEAFQFQDFRKNSSDNYNEQSINWEDSDEAVDVLLRQKKEGSEDPQFKIGFARMSFSRIKDVLKPHISDKTYSFERKPVDGNPYHGNLLADAKLPRQIVKNIQHSLATIATADVYLRSDENIKYLKKENKTMPKVSVIVPIYGVEKYIERCARSLFEQTLDDIEYLFIDDCTPDKSIEILKQVLEEYPQRKPQVTIHRMEKNSGQAVVRKWGILNATGEYVIHCDSDDWVEKEMYEILYNTAINAESDIVRCNFDRVTETNSVQCEATGIEQIANTKDVISCLLLGQDLSSTCDKLIKRDLYDSIFFPENNMWEDFYIVLQLFFFSSKTLFLTDTFYHYFQNPQSICRLETKESAVMRFNNELIAFKNVISFLENHNQAKEYSNEIANLKMHIKEELIPFMSSPDIKKLWKDTFGEIGYSYLTNPTMRRNSKIKYLLCDLGLYRLLKLVLS